VIGRPRDASDPVAWFNYVGPRFFETMGINVDGRDIRVDDDERAPAVAVISRSLARRYFPGVSPVGRRIRFDSSAGPAAGGPVDVEIVGVAADVKYTGLRTEPTEMIYLPFFQGHGSEGAGLIFIALRAARTADETAAALRRDLRANAPDLLIAELATLNERRDGALARERVVAALSMWFAGLALLLGCVGLYGTLSYAVTRRTSELGVRVALGAEWPRLVMAVLGESLRPVLVGAVVGLPLAFTAGRISENLLFSIRGGDPRSYVIAIAALLLSGAAAAAVPARRATRIDPIVALRAE
jgi:MacB-like periplasmic core domain